MAQLREALQALERDEKSPSGFSSPENAIAAILQSYLADKVLGIQKVEQSPSNQGKNILQNLQSLSA
jgi:hypothetical protein